MPHTIQHLKLVDTLAGVRSDAAQAVPAVALRDFSAWFGDNCIVSGVDVTIPAHGITCIVGPSGSGKSTLLRSLNRINDTVSGFSMRGDIHVQGQHIYDDFRDVTRLRSLMGMVFQKPCVFPRSIKENVLFGVRGTKLSELEKNALVEDSLRAAVLWSDVAQRLDQPATSLSLGQQQRLCIARALAVKPKILLLDEPTASVDPVTMRAIETLLVSLKSTCTLLMVTHDLRQTKRIADHVLFLCDGDLIESGPADHMFSKHAKVKTQTYLNEEFCDC